MKALENNRRWGQISEKEINSTLRNYQISLRNIIRIIGVPVEHEVKFDKELIIGSMANEKKVMPQVFAGLLLWADNIGVFSKWG